jgi:beta-lactamase superfamily II metal-dependent hydrolase
LLFKSVWIGVKPFVRKGTNLSISFQPDRRTLLKSVMYLSLASAMPGYAYAALLDSGPLPARRDGEMDIHHIDTGRGNCTLIVAPDGTSIMIDAGSSPAAETTSELRPSAAMRPGQWQGRYAQRYTGADKLDYFVATHIHPDHVGDILPDCPQSPSGAYRLTGVSDVDAIIPIATVIDRAFPSYGDTQPPASAFADNYLAFLQHRVATGQKVEAAIVGSDRQIRAKQPTFKARMLAASGHVWTGHGESSTTLRPALDSLAPEDRPSENFYSLALRFTYGSFSYFAGGDLNCDTHDGRLPWADMESPVARIAGRTEVAAADHHGYFDACGPEFIRALDARAYIIPAWDIGHPGSAQLQRMLGAWSGKATHDVFATDMLPANQLVNRRFTPLMKSRRGHVVVRVAPGGDTYNIFVLDSSIENGNITASFGPYHCRA